MAKSGPRDRNFRFCSERDTLRTPHVPAGDPARNSARDLPSIPVISNLPRALPRRFATAMLTAGIVLFGFCMESSRVRADTQWWALGTFIWPLGDGARRDGEAMRIKPAGWAAFEKGNAAASAGDHKLAVSNHGRAIEIYGPKSPLAARVYAQRAKSLQSLGRHQEAIRDLSAMIAVQGNHPEGYWARGNIHMQRSDFDKALADFETVVKMSPELVGAHMNRGMILHKLNRAELALRAFSDTIEAARKRHAAIARYWKSSVYAKSTPQFVKTMLSLVRSDSDKTIAEAYVRSGKVHFSRSRYEDAHTAYGDAIKAAPDYVLAYKYRGWLNEKTGHKRKARADYQKASEINDGDPWTQNALRRLR